VVAGIAILAIANSGADCDAHGQPGIPDSNCQSTSGTASTVGLSLIVVGLLGFIATVSTTPADNKRPITTITAPAPALQPPPMQLPPAQPQPPPDTNPNKTPPAGT
jgi:hypothetical protein